MEPHTYTVFAGDRLVVSGELETVLRHTKAAQDRGEFDRWLIFDDSTGQEVDFDFRGTIEDVLARVPHHPVFVTDVPGQPRSGPGRPKLGVVSREVSLLPRHWEWLEQQPNGISAALRRLVDEARKANAAKDRVRAATEAAGRFMTVVAGNLPGFEEALRALYAHNEARFEEEIHDWPNDVREHARRLASMSFPSAAARAARE
jgi:hypothetical protein